MTTDLPGQAAIARQDRPAFPGGFTVLMSVYERDSAELFGRALASVYQNSVPPDDFVLVVDGPVSSAVDAVIEDAEAAHRVRTFRLLENGGLARALNHGLSQVRTEWTARADADDLNLSNRFEKQAAAVLRRRGAVDLLGGAILETDRQGAGLAVRRVPLTSDAIARRLSIRNPFNHMTVVYRTELARRVGGYPSIHLKEDYGLWASMIASGARCLNLDDVLVTATTGPDMYRRRGGLRHASSEVGLQLHLYRLGHKGVFSAIGAGLIRAIVSCLPALLRGWMYRSLLREPCSGDGPGQGEKE